MSVVVDAPLVEAAKFKEQAKRFLIEPWLDVEGVYAQCICLSVMVTWTNKATKLSLLISKNAENHITVE